MHDWTLLDIRIDWAAGLAELVLLDDCSMQRSVHFRGLCNLSVDRREYWGPSSSINESSWAGRQGESGVCLKIEMQSGGIISISAAAAEFDDAPRPPHRPCLPLRL